MAGRAFSNGAVRENNAIEREQRASSANSTRDHHSIKKKELLDKLITQLTMKLSSVLMGLATLAVVGEATLRRNLGNMDYYLGRSNKQPAILKWWNGKGGQDARMQRVVGPRDSIGTALGGAIMSKFFDDDDDLGMKRKLKKHGSTKECSQRNFIFKCEYGHVCEKGRCVKVNTWRI